jgi:hypothetical protein
MSNIQVTHDTNLNNARSESNIVVNPNNPMQIVAASKKFRDIHNYDFILATEYSNDGGLSWHDSADLSMPGFTLLTDPAMAWDDVGNVFLVGLSGNNPPTFDTVGIEIYKSIDGGQTWSEPNRIHTSTGDDKQWAAGDGNPASPFHGHVYAVWDDGSNMRFGRTLDYGNTWIGTGADSPGSILVNDSFSPEINVAADGTVYIVWISGSEIKMIVSTDGGNSFQPAASPATGITTLNSLPAPHGWPVFPGGSFRVLTVPTACASGQTVAVAWADYREGFSRIYYAISTNGGASWTTGPNGQPLLTGALSANLHHFHPQIISDSNGVIGCTFYEFGPKPTTPLIDVIMAQSFDGGASFNHFTITDQPWDPAVDAPWSHGDSNVTFIGDYFGLDTSYRGFYPLWTDTRTGIQELWTAIVPPLDVYPQSIAAAKQLDNQLDVFFIGNDRGLYVSWVIEGGVWQGPVRITPENIAPPGAKLAAAKQLDNQLDVFFIGNDGGLYVSWVIEGGVWQGPVRITPENIALPGASLTTAKQLDNQLDVFFIGNDGGLYVSWVIEGGVWQGPVRITPENIALPGASLAAAKQLDNQLDVFFIGNDGGLYVSWVIEGGVWQGPVRITPENIALPGASLAAAKQLDNQLDVFFIGNDGGLYVSWVIEGGVWQGPVRITPENIALPGASLAAAKQLDNQLDVFFIGNDGGLYVSWVIEGGVWQGPVQIISSP